LPKNISPLLRSGRSTVKVWGAISGGRKSRLVILDDANNKAQGFVDTVYENELRWFTAQVKNPFLMEDNAPTHTSKIATNWRLKNGISRMLWPANSPDLNPIENIWSILKRRLNSRPRQPTSKEEMVAAILEEWDKIPTQVIADLIASMKKRVAEVLKANGGSTTY